jgi:hypothetical protein
MAISVLLKMHEGWPAFFTQAADRMVGSAITKDNQIFCAHYYCLAYQ